MTLDILDGMNVRVQLRYGFKHQRGALICQVDNVLGLLLTKFGTYFRSEKPATSRHLFRILALLQKAR